MANFVLNGVTIKNPTTFKREPYKVTNMERLTDATMTGDLIARKWKFYFTYDVLTGEELDAILEASFFTDALFFTLEYLHNGVSATAQVYIGSIPHELHHAGKTTNWKWKNINFNLIEQ